MNEQTGDPCKECNAKFPYVKMGCGTCRVNRPMKLMEFFK